MFHDLPRSARTDFLHAMGTLTLAFAMAAGTLHFSKDIVAVLAKMTEIPGWIHAVRDADAVLVVAVALLHVLAAVSATWIVRTPGRSRHMAALSSGISVTASMCLAAAAAALFATTMLPVLMLAWTR